MFDDNGKTLKPFAASTLCVEGAHTPRTRNGETVLRLDSTVFFNQFGQKSTLQYFTYNEDGALLHRTDYDYNFQSGGWYAGEEYSYEYSDEGYLIKETVMTYYKSTCIEYAYDEQGRCIMQASYLLADDGSTWNPQEKMEIEYGAQGNALSKIWSVWNGDSWQYYSRKNGQWDEKGRLVIFELYFWNGTGWVGEQRTESVYYDGPSPDLGEGTTANRTNYVGYSQWQDDAWKMTRFYTTTYDDEGYVIERAENHWNGHNFGGNGGDSLTCREVVTYDEHHVQVGATMYHCVNDSALWIVRYVLEAEWKYDEEGNREGLARNYTLAYSDDYATCTDTVLSQQAYYGYNANGQQTWLLIQTPDEEGRMKSNYESKGRYDSNGAQTYNASWFVYSDGSRLANSEHTFVYDEQGNMVQVLYRGSNGDRCAPPAVLGAAYDPADDEGWVNLERFDFTYEGGMRIEELRYRWADEEWLPSMGQSVEYDFACPLEGLVVPADYTDPYKVNEKCTHGHDGSGGWWTAEQRYYWAEHSATGIAEASRAAFAVTFEDNKLLVAGCADVANYVYSASGMLVYTGHSSSEDLSHLAPGLYVAVSVSGQERIVTKLTID